ncbi:hypothetical protein DWX03_09995 [Coprococcus comes]|uniref:Uncharacterized protein n=1 Tax=Coprococcus comes TaxID=410072 RepID=A0A3R5ZG35_9FIRM|nr:hypothetical protein [Coprococcus comes]RGT89253.1 hypothetical protein DWX03_09995 [Coprococcus comes]
MKKYLRKDIVQLLFTPVSITPLIDTIDTEDACFGLNASRPIAKGDLKWRDALLVAHRVNSNIVQNQSTFLYNKRRTESSARPEFHYRLM